MTMTELTIVEQIHSPALFEAVRRSIASAVDVRDTLRLADRAEIMAAVSEIDGCAISWAEIGLRAERRVGELIVKQKQTVGLNQGAKGSGSNQHQVRTKNKIAPTLVEAGLGATRSEAARRSASAQKLAAIADTDFEAAIEAMHAVKKPLSRAQLLRSLNPRPPKNTSPETETLRQYKKLVNAFNTATLQVRQAFVEKNFTAIAPLLPSTIEGADDNCQAPVETPPPYTPALSAKQRVEATAMIDQFLATLADRSAA